MLTFLDFLIHFTERHQTFDTRSTQVITMAPKGKGENTKKAAGNAKKAEVAAQKKAVEDSKREAVEDKKWQQGSKDTSKTYDVPFRTKK